MISASRIAASRFRSSKLLNPRSVSQLAKPAAIFLPQNPVRDGLFAARRHSPWSLSRSPPEWDGALSEGDAFHSRLVVLKASWGGQDHAVYAMFWAIGPAYDELIDEARAAVDGARLPEG